MWYKWSSLPPNTHTHTHTHNVMVEPTSWFGLNKQDYWSWIKTLPDYYFLDKLVELDNLTVDKVLMCPSPFSCRQNPLLRQVVQSIASSNKVKSMHSEALHELIFLPFSTGHAQCRSVVGKGRCFIRVSLCQKLITVPIEHLVKNERHTNYWYSAESIIGDQALRGIYTYSA